MSKELKPCPFCEGHAEFEDDTDGSFILKVWHKQDCPACMQSDSETWSTWFYPEEDFDIPEKAVEEVATWWNTRAEQTCRGESDLSEWVCSKCKCWIPTGITPENQERVSEWNFCPSCGRKVVSK